MSDIDEMCDQAIREVRTDYMRVKRNIIRWDLGEPPAGPPPLPPLEELPDPVYGDDPSLRRPWFR